MVWNGASAKAAPSETAPPPHPLVAVGGDRSAGDEWAAQERDVHAGPVRMRRGPDTERPTTNAAKRTGARAGILPPVSSSPIDPR